MTNHHRASQRDPMSKDKSRKHDRKGRVDTAELRDALLACCDAAVREVMGGGDAR